MLLLGSSAMQLFAQSSARVAPPASTPPSVTAPVFPSPGVTAGATPAPGLAPGLASSSAVPGSGVVNNFNAGLSGGSINSPGPAQGSVGSIGGATGTSIGGATGAGPSGGSGSSVGGMSPGAQQIQTSQSSTLYQTTAPGIVLLPTIPMTVTGGAGVGAGALTPTLQLPSQSQGQIIAPGSSASAPARRRATAGQDDALTTQDQDLLMEVRRVAAPLMASSSPSPKVNFILRNGVVILTGTAFSAEEGERIVTAVRGTPGVVSVVNELALTGSGNVGSGPRPGSIVNPSPASQSVPAPTGRDDTGQVAR